MRTSVSCCQKCSRFIQVLVTILLIITLLITSLDARDDSAPKLRKPPLAFLRRNASSARRRMMGSASNPIFIRMRKPELTARRVPDIPPNASESSVLRLSPTIRFHQESNETTTLSNASVSPEKLKEFLQTIGLSRIAALLEDSGVLEDLITLGPSTLFAPTDEAFQLAPRGTVEALVDSKDKAKLKDLLLSHIMRGHLYASNIRNDFTMPSVHSSASSLRFNIYNGGQVISVSGAQFLDSAKMIGDVLIQPVDRIIYPVAETDIVEKLRRSFNRMYLMIGQSGTIMQLSSGTFTVFSPTDEAFSSLPAKAVEKLINNSTSLRKIILNHIVPGSYFSAALSNGYKLKSLSGEGLIFTTRRGLVMVNGVPVVKPDIPTSNGVLHAINRLLVPEEIAEECHCMPKYPVAPATLRPVPKLGYAENIPEFGSRIKSSPMGTPSPQGNMMPSSSSPVSHHDKQNPTVFQLLASPVLLPDGRMLTFGTANRLFRKSLLFNSLQRNGATQSFTILLPTDSAFRRLSPDTMQALQRSPAQLRRVLEWHILEGSLDPQNLRNNVPVRTIGGAPLVVNILPGGNTLIIGGVRVLSTRKATNGAVFAVDRVIESPPLLNDTTVQIVTEIPTSIKSSGPEDLSLWRRLIEELPDVKKRLKSRENIYTMFVPTNAAFARLPPEQLRRLLSEESMKRDLILSHVVTKAYTRSTITPGLQVPTIGGPIITFDLIHGGFTANRAPVLKPGIVTSNGIVYIVNKLLSWPTAEDNNFYRSLDFPGSIDHIDIRPLMSLDSIAQVYNATIFLKWMETSGLREKLQNQGKCTIFLPTNAAIASMSPTLRMVTVSDTKVLRRLVLYHICPIAIASKWNHAAEENDMLLPSMLPKKSIRCNTYGNGSVLTASGSPVYEILPPSDNGVTVVLLNRTMAPPVGDVFLTASKSPFLKNFTKILRVADMESELRDNGPFTIFAPSKCAFSKMTPEKYQKLIEDKEAARDFILRHVVAGCFYTSGLTHGKNLTSISANNLYFETPPGCITINGNKIKYGDLGATNGVVHMISDVL